MKKIYILTVILLASLACSVTGVAAPTPTLEPTLTSTQTPTSMPTPTVTLPPSPTPAPTETPIPTQKPGTFNQQPSHLEEELFPEWTWDTNPQGVRTTAHVYHSYFVILGYAPDAISVNVGLIRGNEKYENVYEFLPIALGDFLSPLTIEEILEFTKANIDDGSETSTTIDGFEIKLNPDSTPGKDLRIVQINIRGN